MDTLPCMRKQNEVADAGRQESLIGAKNLKVTVIKRNVVKI